jgi:hypothetical protein
LREAKVEWKHHKGGDLSGDEKKKVTRESGVCGIWVVERAEEKNKYSTIIKYNWNQAICQ